VGRALGGELKMHSGVTRTTAWLSLVLALLAGRAAGQGGQGGEEGGEGGIRLEKRWPLDSGGTVRITSPLGKLRVLGWDVDTLAVSARLEPRIGRFFGAGDAHVRTLELAGRAELEVHVPRNVTIWVKSTTADIEVIGVDGTLDLTSVGGTIHVVGTPQDVTAETMSGSVELAGGTGRARVKTVSGDVLLRGASQDLGASTLSGRITVRAAGWQRGGTGVQRGRFESVSGDIRFEGELGRGGVVQVESQSGKIEVSVPATTVADFDAVTIEGTITNTFGAEEPKPRATGAGSGQELRFSTAARGEAGGGGGGAQITARSFKGAILLGRK